MPASGTHGVDLEVIRAPERLQARLHGLRRAVERTVCLHDSHVARVGVVPATLGVRGQTVSKATPGRFGSGPGIEKRRRGLLEVIQPLLPRRPLLLAARSIALILVVGDAEAAAMARPAWLRP